MVFGLALQLPYRKGDTLGGARRGARQKAEAASRQPLLSSWDAGGRSRFQVCQSKGAVPPEAFSKTAGGPPRVGRHEEAISLKIERRASKAPL